MPAGRPRKPGNRDLPPGVYRRRKRFYDAAGKALGPDKSKAALEIARRTSDPLLTLRGSWKHASAEFAKWIADKDCDLRTKTVREYTAQLKVLDKVFGDSLLAEITPGEIGAIKHEMRGRQVLFNRLRSLVSSVWKFASERGFTKAPNPTTEIKTYSERKHKPEIRDEWVTAVLAESDQVLRDWINLSLVCGQRVSDVLILTRQDVRETPTGRELVPPNTKTGAPVRIAVEGDLAAVLDDLMRRERKVSGAYLIQTDAGRRVTYSMIRKRWDEALAEARRKDQSIPHFKRQDLRSKSATDAPETAQERLGHTDARTTKRHYQRRAKLASGGVLPKGKR